MGNYPRKKSELIRGAATVLRRGNATITLRRGPLPRLSRALRQRFAFPGSSVDAHRFSFSRILRKIFLASIVVCIAASTSVAIAYEKITITGSSTIAPLIAEIGKRYESIHPGVRVDVQAGGSSRGITDARQGSAQIGMVSRKLKDEENDLQSYQIAQDGVCLIINSANPLKKLTNAQVINIYKGVVNNWVQLGGRDGRIVVVNKAEGRSTLELFLHYFKLNVEEIKADVIIGENQQGIKVVAGNPNAIGYVSIGSAEYESLHGAPIKLLPVNGKTPSTASVANGEFPISRPLNLVTKKNPPTLVMEFINFARSSNVYDIVTGQYFVPLAKK